MTTLPDILRVHIDYTTWASQRLVQAASQLTEEELNRDFKTANGSVLGTLVHVFAADRIWLARIQKTPHSEFVTAADHNFSVLEKDWPMLLDRWKQLLAGVTAESAVEPLAYKDLKGNPWTQPLWQIVLHVVNHGTHHRGQVSGFLRAMGHVPPPIDLVVYHREVLPSK